ncbi:MAG: gamma-glutamylcyclotransferase [Acidiferrobacterales bacterium]
MRLDRIEPVAEGSYERNSTCVRLPSGELLDCWVHVGKVFADAPYAPSTRYLQTILKGAHEHSLPQEYVEWVRREFPASES